LMTAHDEGAASDLSESVRHWRERHQGRLVPGDVDANTRSGLSVQPLYTPLDSSVSSDSYLDRLGLPGEPPFTRGVVPGMYRERLWVMGQYSGQSSPKETNLRIR